MSNYAAIDMIFFNLRLKPPAPRFVGQQVFVYIVVSKLQPYCQNRIG